LPFSHPRGPQWARGASCRVLEGFSTRFSAGRGLDQGSRYRKGSHSAGGDHAHAIFCRRQNNVANAAQIYAGWTPLPRSSSSVIEVFTPGDPIRRFDGLHRAHRRHGLWTRSRGQTAARNVPTGCWKRPSVCASDLPRHRLRRHVQVPSPAESATHVALLTGIPVRWAINDAIFGHRSSGHDGGSGGLRGL